MTLKNAPKTTAFALPWLLLMLVALDYFTLYLHRNLVNFLQRPIMEDLQIGDSEIGLLFWAFYFPYAVSQLFIGYLGDRFRRRTVLLGSLLGSVLLLAAMGFVQQYWQLLALRVLLGFAQAASVPAIASVMADCFSPNTRSTAVSVYLFSYSIAEITSGRIGGGISDVPSWNIALGSGVIEVAGWRMAIFVFAVVGGIIALALFVVFREPARTERAQGQGLGLQGGSLFATLRSVLTVKAYLVFAAVFLLHCIVINVVQFWLPRYFEDGFAMSRGDAGTMATVPYHAGRIAGLILGGVLADWFARIAKGGRTAVLALGAAAWIPSLFVIGPFDQQIILISALTLFGLGVGLYQCNLWTTTFEVVDPASRATAIGLLNVAAGIGASWAPQIVGALKSSASVPLNIQLASLSAFATLALILLVVNIKIFLPRDYRGPLK